MVNQWLTNLQNGIKWIQAVDFPVEFIHLNGIRTVGWAAMLARSLVICLPNMRTFLLQSCLLVQP